MFESTGETFYMEDMCKFFFLQKNLVILLYANKITFITCLEHVCPVMTKT